ncbi:methyltransferase [Desulfotruncus alcoholivorax]|uniref:methyltransferase n=1 Tax=Desulfotruncus alcoholivorax TaxID=265477 RepID=UPI00041D1457|nr:methyltransferase [Desulfotruncus alcoholivorax]
MRIIPNVSSFQLPQEFLIVGAAVTNGLFDALKDGPYTLVELADKTGSDLRALWVVVEALVALGYLKHEAPCISLTDEAYSIFYDENSEQYVGFGFMHAYNLMHSWLQLPKVLESGKPATRERRSGLRLKSFILAMRRNASPGAQEIVDFCLKDLPQSPAVLDVGGGPLTYALAFVERGAEVTVLDTPEVVDLMLPGLDPGLPIHMVKGDFTVALPRGPYDLVYLGNVCHIYGEKENRKLFREAAAELNPGGRVVINDIIRGTGVRAAVFGVNMLVNTECGGTWTYNQYKTWLEEAGFMVTPVSEVAGRQLITGIKN